MAFPYEDTEKYDLHYLIQLEDTIQCGKDMLEELYIQYELDLSHTEMQAIIVDIGAYESSVQNARREATKALIRSRGLRLLVDDSFPQLQRILQRMYIVCNF